MNESAPEHSSAESRPWPGVAFAMASAVLFGASTPLAKLLIGEGTSPWLLAGLLYLGSGFGLSAIALGRRLARSRDTEAPIARSELPWLALVLFFGGVLGPLLLMIGLANTSASSAALLLNLEGLATMTMAWVVFHENVDRRLLLGAFAILSGAAILSWRSGPVAIGSGSLAIAGACVAWGIDNNLTRKLSGADPLQIALTKGLAAGSVNFGLAMAFGARLPGNAEILGAGAIGFLGYGVSLVLFVLALRHLGVARTGAYFSTAPFIGAVVALLIFGEPLTLRLLIAAVLMALGVYLHLTEAHDHEHAHEALDHEHRHIHDDHHRHAHEPGDPPGEPHTHRHNHEPMRHKHPHYPDLHHRHDHA